MPIVESRIDEIEPQRPGRQRVHFYFREHTGREHVQRIDVPVGYDTADHIVRHTATMNTGMIKSERERIQEHISDGDDPATITTDHITAKQKLMAITLGFMHTRAQKAVITAEWLRDNISDSQLNTAIGAQRRQKVRQRQTSVLALKVNLQADEGMRDG